MGAAEDAAHQQVAARKAAERRKIDQRVTAARREWSRQLKKAVKHLKKHSYPSRVVNAPSSITIQYQGEERIAWDLVRATDESELVRAHEGYYMLSDGVIIRLETPDDRTGRVVAPEEMGDYIIESVLSLKRIQRYDPNRTARYGRI